MFQGWLLESCVIKVLLLVLTGAKLETLVAGGVALPVSPEAP